MRLNLVLELLDVPGKLVAVLEPIGTLGANLVTVIHQREIKTERGLIPVQITIEGEPNTLDLVMKKLDELGIKVIEMDGVILKETIKTILIGNIVDRDVKDTMDQINQLDGVRVADLALKMAEEPLDSSARITVEADFGKKDEVMEKIHSIGHKKDFLVISEV
jgi:ACT domain-containing protein